LKEGRKMYKKKLLELGMHADINGFEFLNYAIDIYKPTQSIIAVYEEVAEKFDTSLRKVERSMRHAIAQIGQKDTVGQFIAKYKILWND
jgi:hypothetical protein